MMLAYRLFRLVENHSEAPAGLLEKTATPFPQPEERGSEFW
jgi:hypothetical protein